MRTASERPRRSAFELGVPHGPALWRILACCVGLPALIQADSPTPGSWSRKAPMPMAISTPAACAVDGILYVIGGHDRDYHQLASVFAYDPKTDQWSRKADMPTARRWLSAVAVDGIIYAIGGGGWISPVSKVVEAYDPRTDTWTARAPMPTGRFTFAVGAVDGLIYAMGGGDHDLQPLGTVEAYDPKADRWTARKPMPQAVGLTAAATDGGLIHVCHGSDVFTYDPAAEKWSTRSPFATWRHAAMAGSVDGVLYLFGGCSSDYATCYTQTAAFDLVAGRTMAKRHMTRPRAFGASAVIDGKIYLVGGADQEPVANPSAIFWSVLDVFDPKGGIVPHITGVAKTPSGQLQLTWHGEPGVLYAVSSATDVASGLWSRVTLSSGSTTVQATNATVGVTLAMPPATDSRFFRVIDVDH